MVAIRLPRAASGATRRAFLAGASLAPFAPASVVSALTNADSTPTHGIAMHGLPALPADFAHLPYANPAAPKGGRLSVAFAGTFDSLNPFNLRAGSAAQGLSGNVFQTMMARSLDEPFTLYGLIAQTIETDAERNTVTFRLNPAAHFSDGTPVTSDDVLFTFNLLKTRGRPQQRYAFSLVTGVTAPDALTVRYDLSGVNDREMPLTLALMPVLSRRTTDLTTFNDSSLRIPTASGPYKIASVAVGERLVLRRNPDYWGRDIPMCRGLYNFDEIVITYFRDATSMFESFKAGLIDYRDETNTTRWISGYGFPAIRDGRVKREQLPLGVPRGMEGFAFNTRRPLFRDIRVREALATMFDFEWVNANLFAGLYTRTVSFFDNSELASTAHPASEGERVLLAPFPNAVRPDILEGRWRPYVTDGTGRDRNQAKTAFALLAQAGWTLEGGALKHNGEPFTFEIMVTDRSQERLALNYASSLARVGVGVRVRAVDEVQYQRRRQKFDFDMMLGTWLASASPGNEQRMRWGEGSAEQEASFNLAGAKSPAIDALIKALLAARSREDFVMAVRAYDRVLLSGFYIVPLFHTAQQWDAYWTKLARPATLPKAAAPLFGATLDTWWSATA